MRWARRVRDVKKWDRLTGKGRRRSKIEFKDLFDWDVTGQDGISSGIARVPPGKIHGSHRHPHATELYYVLKGRARVSVGDEWIDADEGTEIFIPKGMDHCVVNDGDEDFEFLYVMHGRYSMSDYE